MKIVQQLSWDVTTLDKRYPLDKVSENDLEAILEAYQTLTKRFMRAYEEAFSDSDSYII